jgi:hypothetical protein
VGAGENAKDYQRAGGREEEKDERRKRKEERRKTKEGRAKEGRGRRGRKKRKEERDERGRKRGAERLPPFVAEYGYSVAAWPTTRSSMTRAWSAGAPCAPPATTIV